jgi:hypothetical protein
MSALTRTIALGLAIVGVGGCSSQPGLPAGVPPDVEFDAEAARAAIGRALDAWKAGAVKSLPKQSPPILFEDDDLITGHSLVSWSFASPTAPILPCQNVGVQLTLRARSGESVERLAHYQVLTSPKLSVRRTDF